jgi:hypothetical protein
MADIKKMMFNGKYGLEQAVLNGTKTMTRRLSKKIYCEDENQYLCWTGEFVNPKYNVDDVVGIAQPYKDIVGLEPQDLIYTTKVIDGKKQKGYFPVDTLPGWSNKMFVQGQYMQYYFRITDVKIERLQDISDEDCLREGILIDENAIDENKYYFDVYGKHVSRWWFPTPKDAFEGLITKLNGKDFWNLNPYVYVYSFELIKPN